MRSSSGECVFISTDRCVCVAEDLWERDGEDGVGLRWRSAELATYFLKSGLVCVL